MTPDDESDIEYSARFVNASAYSAIASDNCRRMQEAYDQLTAARVRNPSDTDALLSASELSRCVFEASAIAVVFSGMAIEAYLFDYGARHLSARFVKKYVDTLSVDAKLVVLPRLITGKPLPTDGQGFELVVKLVKNRNKLVHAKSCNIKMTSDLLPDAVEKRLMHSRTDALDATKAIREIAKEIESIHPDESASFHLGVKTD